MARPTNWHSQKRHPLDAIGYLSQARMPEAGDGVRLSVPDVSCHIGLRGDLADKAFLSQCEDILGFALPQDCGGISGNEALQALWTGPDSWRLIGDGDAQALLAALRQGLAERHSAVVDLSDAMMAVQLRGPFARDTLAKGCPLDLSSDPKRLAFCAHSLLSRCQILLHDCTVDASGLDCYRLYVGRSFCEYVWAWLSDAAEEYGLCIERL